MVSVAQAEKLLGHRLDAGEDITRPRTTKLVPVSDKRDAIPRVESDLYLTEI